TDAELAGGLFGAGRRVRARERARDVLTVRVKAMDLRQVTRPILVGHYEQDAISGAEALIDRDVVHGELSVRHHLGMYAGAVGSATAVLLKASPQEAQRGSLRGAVVAGLGQYDGSLTVGTLTEAVRGAGLRYLVQVLDSGAVAAGTEQAQGLKLASLLLGYNSAANLSIADSVQALMRGIVDANRHFAQASNSKLRIDSLDIVELYLDSAITATYAARQIAQTINADPHVPCVIVADPVLHQGEGMRQRLLDGRGGSYWPRLMITEDRRAGDDTRSVLAERLRYLYLGQRARAESVVQQRQPGLVERLVARQVTSRVYDPDFSRTLFQLLVPHDFKDAARQFQQMVFVLDATTANLPWELMLAEEEPLATRTAMVRQLATTRFRSRVDQTLEQRACVIGNPSTDGFFKAFPDPKQPGNDGALDDLPSAEKEALAVIDALARHGFEIERAVGQSQRAIDVVNRLYKHPYRIVHIAGHGMVDEAAGPDRARSGVVLSDGLLITAAEIAAMEIVPDLVFLNCCHLGQIERSTVAFNRLAAGVARQLIEIGVRAVVVAGWAVEDDAARLFAETFYDKLLADNLCFGDAVFKARCVTWQRYPAGITWGAYQAYGDPAWRADLRSAAGAMNGGAAWCGVAAEELIDRLAGERQELQRSGEVLSASEARRLVAKVKQWFDAAPPVWRQRPDLASALGDLYADLGPEYFPYACECYERAIRTSDPEGRTTVHAVEQLANVQARLGEVNDDAALVGKAIQQIEQLLRVTATTVERAGLLGGAWKRKAAVHARAFLAGHPAELARMRDALDHSIAAYGRVASALDAKEVLPYPTLNWLFLWSISAAPEQRSGYLMLAQRCAAAANAAYADDPDAWNSTMVAEAALVTALLDGSLAAPAPHGDATLEVLAAGYADA
ncbi:MAG TPA: CHAT domain-containing protein, partial [Albitalea sp.]|nr:CHAT domain-containing protein [Albitalea sp.]